MRKRRLSIVAIAAALMLLPVLADQSFAQGRGGRGGNAGGNAAKPRPTPRWPDGTVNFGPPVGETGLWNVAGGVFAIPDPAPGVTIDPGDAQAGKPTLSQVPFQPWTRAIYDYRQENELEPYTRCKPSGAFRQVATAYGTQFVHFPEQKQFIIFQTGGSHSYRIIHMDGRQHPKDLAPSYYGHSIGHFEGDTLVVDTIGYNERMWISNLEGMPHSGKLHTIERFTRTDMNNMRYELTIDDPGAYTSTWKTVFAMRFNSGVESFEFICQDGNQAFDLMVGSMESVDRTSPFVP